MLPVLLAITLCDEQKNNVSVDKSSQPKQDSRYSLWEETQHHCFTLQSAVVWLEIWHVHMALGIWERDYVYFYECAEIESCTSAVKHWPLVTAHTCNNIRLWFLFVASCYRHGLWMENLQFGQVLSQVLTFFWHQFVLKIDFSDINPLSFLTFFFFNHPTWQSGF